MLLAMELLGISELDEVPATFQEGWSMDEKSSFLNNLAAKVCQEVWHGERDSSYILDSAAEADNNQDEMEECPCGQCESTRDELLRVVLIVVLTISSHPCFK